MNTNSHLPPNFSELAVAACEGTATHDQLAELDQLLSTNAAAVAAYCEHCQLDADLRLFWRSGTALDNAFEEIAFEEIREQEIKKAESGKRKAEEATTQYSVPGTHQSPIRAWERALWRHRLGVGIAAGAFFVAALLGWAAMTYLPGLAKNEPPIDEQPVVEAEWIALLNDQHNVQWLDDTKPAPNRPRLVFGQRLAISAGLLEINYRTGARVVLEGPAEFVVGGTEGEGTKAEGTEALSKEIARSSVPQSSILNPQSSPANSGYLARGTLVASCETTESQGFTIETPTVRVIDLGTEFSLDVDATGRSLASVLSGKVTTTPRIDGVFDESQRVTLTVREQVVISSSGRYVGTVRKLTVNELARLPRPILPKLVSLVSDDFESPALTWPDDFESRGFVRMVPQGWHARGTVWIAHEKGQHFRHAEFSGQAVTLGGGDPKLPSGSIVRSIGKTRLGNSILVEFIQVVQGGATQRRNVANVTFEFFDGDPRSGGASIGKLTLVGKFAGRDSIHRRETVVLERSYDEPLDLYVQITRQPQPRKAGNIVIDQLEISTRIKEAVTDKAP